MSRRPADQSLDDRAFVDATREAIVLALGPLAASPLDKQAAPQMRRALRRADSPAIRAAIRRVSGRADDRQIAGPTGPADPAHETGGGQSIPPRIRMARPGDLPRMSVRRRPPPQRPAIRPTSNVVGVLAAACSRPASALIGAGGLRP